MKRPPISSKQKDSLHKETWTELRRRYTWYLRPPFVSHFDRSHWWDGQSEIEPAAALYELVRRHPLVGEQWLRRVAAIKRNHRELRVSSGHPLYGEAMFSRIISHEHWFEASPDKHMSPSLYWTCLFGLNSWATLDYTDRVNWKCSVGFLKGLDFRWEELQCRSVNELAEWKIRDEREDALGDKVKGKRRGKEIGEIINADLAANPPTVEEWEAAIAYRAVEAYRKGYLLLAVAGDLHAEKAASLMEKVYGFARRSYANTKQRARWEDWLPIITLFEDAEASRDKAKNQVFARYRRALDGIHFA